MGLFRKDERRRVRRRLKKLFKNASPWSVLVHRLEREYKITGYTEKDIDIFLSLPKDHRRIFEKGGIFIPSIEGNIPYHMRRDMPEFDQEEYERSRQRFIEWITKEMNSNPE